MATLIGTFTNEGLQKTIDAANSEGFFIFPKKVGISETAGALVATRDLASINVEWIREDITSFNEIAFDQLEVIFTIPPAFVATAKTVAEIYLFAENNAIAEITKILTVADVAGNLDGKFITLQDKDGSVAFWFDIDDSGTSIPGGAAVKDRAIEVKTIATGDSASVVAQKIATAIAADSQFTASFSSNEVLVTDLTEGARVAADAETSGFTVSEDQAGVDAVLFLLAIAQPDDTLIYDPDGSLKLRLQIKLTNVDLSSNFNFLFTQANEIEDHNNDPNAHPKLLTTLSKTGVHVLEANEQFVGQAHDQFPIFEPGNKEKTEYTTVADSSGSLDGTFFKIFDDAGSVAFWFDIDDSGTSIPGGASAADRAIEITTVNTDDSASVVATKVNAVINADSKFDATVSAPTKIEAESVTTGTRTDATAETSGFSVSVLTQGDDNEVIDNDVVFLDSADNTYRKAISDGTIKSKAAGFANVTLDSVSSLGFYQITHAFADNTQVFLDDTLPGKITATVTGVRLGRTLKTNLIYIDILDISDIGNLVGGGGGAGTLKQILGVPAPEEIDQSGVEFLGFDETDIQKFFLNFQVPDNHVTGTKLILAGGKFYVNTTSGKVLFKTNTALVKKGTSTFDTFPNIHVSTNTEVTPNAAADKQTEIGDIDLTDANGQIDSVDVEAEDMLRIEFFRDTANESTPAPAQAKLIRNSLNPIKSL